MNKNQEIVEANLSYIVDDGIPPVMYVDWPEEEHKAHLPTYEDRRVKITNGRPSKDKFNLEVHGFAFAFHKTSINNFYDEASVMSICYPEVGNLITRHIKCSRVLVFDHTIRAADEEIVRKCNVRQPVKAVHNDYTEKSAFQRVRDLLDEGEVEKVLENRFAIVQLWRPINNVESDPLAICDGRTIPEEGFIAMERRYPYRTAEVYHISYNEHHKWIYFPKMTRNEVLIFKVFDTDLNAGVRFTAHSAFEDPSSSPNAKPRESIEFRALAFFD